MSKSYQAYMEVLRSRDARPAFSKITAVVENAPVTGTTKVRSMIAVLLLLLATGSFVWSRMDRTSTPILRSTQRAIASPEAAFQNVGSERFADDRTFATNKQKTSIRLHHTFSIANVAPTVTTDASDEPTDKGSPLIKNCDPVLNDPASVKIAPVAIALQSIALDSGAVSKWSMFVGASGSRQFSAQSTLRANSIGDLFAGVGYQLSQCFTVNLLGGETVYLMPSTSSVMTYRDTTFEHNNQVYHNVIGSLVPISTVSQSRVYWLGGSIVYSVGDEWRPCIELGGAASQQGMMLNESIGVARDISEALEARMTVRGTQLNAFLNSSHSWLTKIGVSIALSHRF